MRMIKAMAALITLAVSAIAHLYAILAGVLSAWAQERSRRWTRAPHRPGWGGGARSGGGEQATHYFKKTDWRRCAGQRWSVRFAM